MVKSREVYRCRQCGAQTPQWRGQCPTCHAWNTMEAELVSASSSSARHSVPRRSARAQPLGRVSDEGHTPYGTGLEALDRVLGKGFVPGAAILVGGEPGIGKSTLLLQVAGSVARNGRVTLYASGEESLPQIRSRAERLGVLHDNLLALSTSRVQDIFPLFEEDRAPALLIVDSVQTLASDEAEGLPGNVSQVRAVATELVERCKKSNTTLLLVGHVTKDGQEVTEEEAELARNEAMDQNMEELRKNWRSVAKTLLGGLHFVNKNGQPLRMMPKLELDPALLEQPLYH